jgi:outer membrane protein OmpA-like peptidoglycan-associated protein
MSKRESTVGIFITLLVTFGLGAGSIWWAYQFGFGTNSSSVQSLPNSSNSVAADSTPTITAPVTTQPKVSQTPIPTLTPTPQPVKKADELQKLPIREEVKFVVDSIVITPEGRTALEQLANIAVKYNEQDVVIRINVGKSESESGQALAQQRGEEIAGILRDKGFAKKIIISKRSNDESSRQTRNKPVEISLTQN